MINKQMTFFKIIVSIILMLIVTACSDSQRFHALQNAVNQLKQTAAIHAKKEPPFHFHLPTPVTYQTGLAENNTMLAGSIGQNKLPKNPIERYSLKSLQFVGMITESNQSLAYIMTPDGMVYPVKEGDVISNNYDKIVKINSDGIEIKEKYQEAGSTVIKERNIVMRLKE